MQDAVVLKHIRIGLQVIQYLFQKGQQCTSYFYPFMLCTICNITSMNKFKSCAPNKPALGPTPCVVSGSAYAPATGSGITTSPW